MWKSLARGKDFGFSNIFTGECADEIAQEAHLGNIYVRGYDAWP